MSEGDDVPAGASYSARLSMAGHEGRQSSFMTKISLENVAKEGGALDNALGFTKPSSMPLYNPFRVCTEVDDADLRIAAEEDEDQIKSHIELSERLLKSTGDLMSKAVTRSFASFQKMSDDEVVILKSKYFDEETAASHGEGECGERNLMVATATAVTQLGC